MTEEFIAWIDDAMLDYDFSSSSGASDSGDVADAVFFKSEPRTEGIRNNVIDFIENVYLPRRRDFISDVFYKKTISQVKQETTGMDIVGLAEYKSSLKGKARADAQIQSYINKQIDAQTDLYDEAANDISSATTTEEFKAARDRWVRAADALGVRSRTFYANTRITRANQAARARIELSKSSE